MIGVLPKLVRYVGAAPTYSVWKTDSLAVGIISQNISDKGLNRQVSRHPKPLNYRQSILVCLCQIGSRELESHQRSQPYEG